MDSGSPSEVVPLPVIRAGIACNDCPYGGAKCGTRGREDSPVVILGEAPGVQEIRVGKPFVGPSGQLLKEGLPTGFLVDDALVLNSVRCIVAGGKSGKDVAKMVKAVNECRPWVIEHIAKHPRKLIIAMGSWACISITKNPEFKITRSRGEILRIPHPGREFEECLLAPVYHPAFLLRGKGNLKQWRADIAAALDFVQNSGGTRSIIPPYIEPKYKVLDTAEKLWAFHDWCAARKRMPIGADIETSGFNPHKDWILCLGLYPEEGPEENTGYIIPEDFLFEDSVGSEREAVESLLALDLKWIWHNGKFDTRFLRMNKFRKARVVEDTILISYAMDEHQGKHGLEDIAKDLLKAPNYKDALRKYLKKKTDSYAKVPKPVLYDYLAKDVKNTLGIWKISRSQINLEQGLQRLYEEVLLPATELLIRIEERGIYVDKAFVEENEQQLLVELQNVQTELNEIAGEYINPNSPQQVSAFLFDKLGLKIKGKRPVSTDKRVLVKLKGNKAVDTITKYRRIAKMLSTYVLPLKTHIDEFGRVHTTYSLTTTTTGRLASKEPNVQNIPREARFRRMYRAAPGYVLIEADYNAAELRMLACLSEDEFLTGIYLDDKRSLHDEVAVAMYGADFTPDERIRAKAINFGIPYGREAFSIAEEFDISTSEAQRLIDAWFERAPQAAAFIKKCRSAPLSGKTLVTAFGRKRRPGVVSYELLDGLQNEFANFPMQSTVADLCTKAAWELEVLGHLATWKAGIVNLVHDSILVECPDNENAIREVKTIMKSVMEGIATRYLTTPITFKVDFKQGTHWGLLKGQ